MKFYGVGKKLIRVSGWITIETKYVTSRHSLYYYADEYGEKDGKRPVSCFCYKGRYYALGQFISRWGEYGFDQKAETYPAFISGYDVESGLYLDKYGERIRLFIEAQEQ